MERLAALPAEYEQTNPFDPGACARLPIITARRAVGLPARRNSRARPRIRVAAGNGCNQLPESPRIAGAIVPEQTLLELD